MTDPDHSAAELVRAWVAAHPWVDVTLAAGIMTLFALLTLAAAGGCLYWLWYIVRLLMPGNVLLFIKKPLPALRSAKLGGAGFEMASDVREAEAGTYDAVVELNQRVKVLEGAVQSMEMQVGRYEDVSGRLPTGGGNA